MADLFKPGSLGHGSGLDDVNSEEDELDEREVEILREAGVISRPSARKGKEKGRRQAPKHIVFVENDGQGTSTVEICWTA